MQLAIRLDPEKDKDIIEFLEDKPKSFILRQAMRRYMAAWEQMESGASAQPIEKKPEPDEDGSDLFPMG